MFLNNRLRHILAGPLGYILVFVFAVVFLYGVLLFVSGTSTVDVLADIQDRGTIVIGVLEDMPPYNQLNDDGTSVGFESDLATMIGEIILNGPGVQFFYVNEKTARAYLDNDDCDMLIAMVPINEENLDDYNLTDPYAQEDVLLISKTGTASAFNDSNTKIGVILGSPSQTVLLSFLESHEYVASVIEVASYPDALEAIDSGRIDAFCAPYSVLSRYARNGLFINPIPVGHLNYAIAVRKSEADLFSAVEDALEVLRNDGRLNGLYSQYGLSAPVN